MTLRPAVGLFLALLTTGSAGCQSRPAARAATETPAVCQERQQRLVGFLGQLPDTTLSTTLRVELPESTLGAVPGSGPVLEISEEGLGLDGQWTSDPSPRDAAAAERRLKRVSAWVDGWQSRSASSVTSRTQSAGVPARSQRPSLYVAAAQDIDVRTLRSYLGVIPESVDVKLLLRTRAFAKEARAGSKDADRAHAIAVELLSESDPVRRRTLAAEGYARATQCDAVPRAVASADARPAAERWPTLRAALLEVLPRCHCGDLDTDALQQVLAAEQRAGAATLGWIPLSFLRDPRCGASMPLRSVGKLVRQIEAFDAEFSGGWQGDALRFEEVLGAERLTEYFCNALPGETLAAQQRASATLYWRVPGSDACQGWRFEPLSPGAPMGTWRRVDADAKEPLAFHYWQAAEEIRVFGPAADSKPTDQRPWRCDENYRLTSVDRSSIGLEKGRWYFDAATCRAAPADAAQLAGCVAALAAESPGLHSPASPGGGTPTNAPK